MICAKVIQTEFKILTQNPLRKYLPEHFVAIMQAQIMKIIINKTGSSIEGIQKTVAKAIVNPKSES